MAARVGARRQRRGRRRRWWWRGWRRRGGGGATNPNPNQVAGAHLAWREREHADRRQPNTQKLLPAGRVRGEKRRAPGGLRGQEGCVAKRAALALRAAWPRGRRHGACGPLVQTRSRRKQRVRMDLPAERTSPREPTGASARVGCAAANPSRPRTRQVLCAGGGTVRGGRVRTELYVSWSSAICSSFFSKRPASSLAAAILSAFFSFSERDSTASTPDGWQSTSDSAHASLSDLAAALSAKASLRSSRTKRPIPRRKSQVLRKTAGHERLGAAKAGLGGRGKLGMGLP